MPKKTYLFLALAALLSSTVVSLPTKPSKYLHPVILVPGDGGSQIEAKLDKPSVVHMWCAKFTSDWYSLWLNLEQLLSPLVLDCFIDNIRLRYDNVSRTTSNQDGVEIRLPGFGNTTTVEWLDSSQMGQSAYFYHITEYLVNKLGYVRGKSVYGAPYDFRKAPNEMSMFIDDLKSLVEKAYNENNGQRVVLIGHSMGNLYVLYMLNHLSQTWKDHYIQSFVSLAAPWGGAVKTLRLMTSGDNLGVFIVNALTARGLQRSMPSTAWLMPSDRFWNDSEILVNAPHYNYTVRDYKKLFTDIGHADGYLMREDTANLVRDLTSPSVEVHCLHGSGLETPGTFSFTESTWFSEQPKVIVDDGDGTVNLRSLLGCKKWLGEQSQKVVHKVFEKAEHLSILSHEEVISYIGSLLVSDKVH